MRSKGFKVFILFFLLLASHTPCYAGWVEFGKFENGTIIYMYTDTHYVPNSQQSKVNAWIKLDIGKTDTDPLIQANPGTKTCQVLLSYDLEMKKAASLLQILYDHNGNILRTIYTDPKFHNIQTDIEQTVYEAILVLHQGGKIQS